MRQPLDVHEEIYNSLQHHRPLPPSPAPLLQYWIHIASCSGFGSSWVLSKVFLTWGMAVHGHKNYVLNPFANLVWMYIKEKRNSPR